GDILWVDTNASSTAEMIYELFLYGKELGVFKMNDAIARLIYGGIVGDTGRFLFPSTSNKTFQYAADLITYDFDRSKLYDGMYSVGSHIARLRGYVLQNLVMSDSGVSSIKITNEILERF